MPKAEVVMLSDHPQRVLGRIREYAVRLDRVRYESNINDLVKAKAVPMSAIWACLEEGELDPAHLHHQKNGTYAKLHGLVAGDWIEVDVLLPQGEDTLIVLYASLEE